LRSWSALDELLDIYLHATRPTGHSKSSAADYAKSCAAHHSEPSGTDHSKSGTTDCSEPSAADWVTYSYADAALVLTASLFLVSVVILVSPATFSVEQAGAQRHWRVIPVSWFIFRQP